MTNDKAERKFVATWGRFGSRGKGKRAASKARRRLAARDIANRLAA